MGLLTLNYRPCFLIKMKSPNVSSSPCFGTPARLTFWLIRELNTFFKQACPSLCAIQQH
jgi:hypothetical protein